MESTQVHPTLSLYILYTLIGTFLSTLMYIQTESRVDLGGLHVDSMLSAWILPGVSVCKGYRKPAGYTGMG